MLKNYLPADRQQYLPVYQREQNLVQRSVAHDWPSAACKQALSAVQLALAAARVELAEEGVLAAAGAQIDLARRFGLQMQGQRQIADRIGIRDCAGLIVGLRVEHRRLDKLRSIP